MSTEKVNGKTRWIQSNGKKDTLPSEKELSKLPVEKNYEKLPTLQPQLYHTTDKVLVPELNKYYDSLGTPQGYRHCGDAWATGIITTVAGQTVSTNISYSLNSREKLSNWPGSVQLFPVLRFFSASSQTAITTVGSISALYQDVSGMVVPLGVFASNSTLNFGDDTIIPSPITDEGSNFSASVSFLLEGTTPSTATYRFSVSLGFAYLLPARKGYKIEELRGTDQQLHGTSYRTN